MASLGEIFNNLDNKYDDFYKEFDEFNKNTTNREKETLLYRITLLKGEIRNFETKLKNMYIPRDW